MLKVCDLSAMKSDINVEPEESPESSSGSSSSSSSGAVDALSTPLAPVPPQASAGEPGQRGDSPCSDSDSPVDSSSCEEEEEKEEDPNMFSSKFLSGAVSSAVNKFGLFGDDGEEDKNQKAPPHQVAKSSAEQQPAGPGKGSQQPQGTKKSGQTPPMQNNQPSPKQGSPQLCKNGQAASPSKPGGQPSHPKTETQPKGPLQQGSPNAGAQQQIMSNTKGHEWLCLNCQIQRAQGTSQSVGPSMKMPMTHKVSAAQHQTSSSVAAVKQDMSGPDSSQKMQLTSAKVPGKGEAAEGPESKTQASPASVQKLTPETQRASRSQKPDKTIHTESKLPSATPAPQQESGGLFGFGSAKTGPAKPEESVSEKMFGFGSSIFSSASSLMASAHHDELKTTPPVSPKMQSRKETKPLSVEKSDQDKKQEQPNQPRASPAGQAKVDKTPSGTPFAAAASQSALKAGQSTCPICKVMLNTGTKDPPNYNTCTDCKSTVCNQCGFNPMPNVKEGKEWLCLNCQVKRAAKETEPQKHTHLVDSSLKKTSSAQPASQKTSQPGSPQRKISTPAAQPPKADAAKGIASHTQDSTVPGQKIPQESQKAGPPKQPDHTTQPAQKQVNATAATQQESGGFFGFGGPKGQTDAAKPTGSVTGKMFGFGSSIFSSASTLISSAVQDESKTTPPVSPKMPAPKDSKSPTAKKSEQDKKPEQPQQAKGSPSVQPKVEKPPAEPPKQASASVGKSTCPLCKLPLNVGSKDPPNYNICTECKITVCSQCGFNPMPNVKEVKEWLCLNCQMQRALGASEPPGTPLMKLQGSPNKGTDPAKTLKKETLQLDKPQKKDIPPTESKIKTSAPGSPQRKLPTDQLAKAEVMKGPESKKQVKEWLCLNCQMQRALSASELTGPPMKTQGAVEKISPSVVHSKITPTNQEETVKKDLSKSDTSLKMEPQMADTLQQKGIVPSGFPQKTEPTVVTKTAKNTKEPESDTQANLTPGQKNPLALPGLSGSQKPTDQANKPVAKQSKVSQDSQDEPGSLFGTGGPKTAPNASKTTESVSRKMLGFGSTIYSSASTLISSAVPEESQTTPPGLRKMSAPAQVSPKLSAVPKISPKSTPTISPKMSPAREPKTDTQKPKEKKKEEESHQSKEDAAPSQPPKAEIPPNMGKASCPLCKVELNIGSKDPLDYNTCTECKTTVCNQCGFNPIPIGEVKEWLCLNCQMKRALGVSEPPGPPTVKPKTSPSKFPLPAAAQLKDSSKLTTPQKKDDLGPTVPAKTSEPVSPQMKPSGITKATTIPLKQASPATDHKKTQEREKRGQNKPLDQASQPTRKQSNVTLATQQESGGFLGFSGTTSHSASAKPAETVSGKMFGFGSSIFSSASTLITSAVQDQPKTTPPVSPKMSPAKEIKSPVVQKLEHQKKSEPPQQTKPPQSEQARVGKAPSELPKTVAASQVSSKQGQSTCPLCKTQLNMSSKNLPNYNTCTKCKNTVCNQCGFNPMPNETTLKEWLCLTCQMQRALGTQPPGITSVTSKIPADPDKKDISRTTEHEKKESAVPHIPQSKPSLTAQPAIADAGSKPDGQKQASPGHSQKMPQGPQKITGPKNVPDQTRQTERKLSNATPVTQQESGGFFGFGGGQSQPDVAKPAESVSGKMFGFGSSIFGSASTLISSAVQNQPKTTPPVSPKLSTVKEKKSPALQKKEEQKKTEQLQQTKTTPLVETKVEKGPSVHPKDAASCPLCKTELNMGSKDPSNYNTCTECKNTVCNKCGFNPAPNESEVRGNH
ncbi:Protein bassoon [Channa argus]|uniref:Protein bassoon n=1 Tax=Channa argus TaxID=215402 RepID=A0A6G1PF51_CHAAH|nr:Protein bassoon [Channa argus]